jgi:hypothetical protein
MLSFINNMRGVNLDGSVTLMLWSRLLALSMRLDQTM